MLETPASKEKVVVDPTLPWSENPGGDDPALDELELLRPPGDKTNVGREPVLIDERTIDHTLSNGVRIVPKRVRWCFLHHHEQVTAEAWAL